MTRLLLVVLLAVGCKPPQTAKPSAARTCAQGDAEACANEGLQLSKAGKDAESAALYRRACDRGSARGCDFLGGRLRDARGVDRDLKAAMAAFERGCSGGVMSACQSLGSMYANGGVIDGSEMGPELPPDLARSFEFHKRACDGGLADGCLSVGFMYEHGEHVAADLAKAVKLYEGACERGSGDGCYSLSLLYADGRGVPKDATKADALVEKGCRARGTFACAALAERFNKKNEPCCTIALLLRACQRGHRQACMLAGILCGASPEDVVAEFQRQCKDAPFTGCEFVKNDRY